MLVYESKDIPEPCEAVLDTLKSVGGEIQVWASAAYRRGEGMAVGPAPLVSAPIELEVGKPIQSLESTTIPMSWIAASATGLFPRMDAEVVISRLNASLTHLEFRGSYRPPLEGVGRVLDRLAFHRIAESTVRNFLDRLAEAVVAEVRAGRPETDADAQIKGAAQP